VGGEEYDRFDRFGSAVARAREIVLDVELVKDEEL
jgi:hypothetical protein